MEDIPSTTRSSAPRSCATGRTAFSFAGVDGFRSVREMEDGSENADLQLTNDYFKEYREALQAVLPSHYSFRVRKVEPPLEHVCGDQLAFGKVLIGRRRDKEASVWAFLEGQNGERVMYRDSDKETVLLPLQLDDFVEFEAVFQLISDPMDLRKFASATEMTRRKRWVGRIALVVRLVLRDFAFYSPTIRVSDTRLKKEAVVEIIRRNLDAMKPYIGHKPSRNGLRTSVESSESQERDGEAASGNISEQFADHSSASQLASGLTATGDEIQAATRGNTSPRTLKWVTEPSTHDQEGRKRDSTASATINSAQHTRSNSIKSTSEPSSPVQKKARLASDAASDIPECYDESIQQGSVDTQSQAVAPLLQTQQSPKEARLRSLTLKGFAERKVKEARQQERDKAAEKLASVECQLQALQNTIDTQRQALEEQEKKHQKAQEQSTVCRDGLDGRSKTLTVRHRLLYILVINALATWRAKYKCFVD